MTARLMGSDPPGWSLALRLRLEGLQPGQVGPTLADGHGAVLDGVADGHLAIENTRTGAIASVLRDEPRALRAEAARRRPHRAELAVRRPRVDRAEQLRAALLRRAEAL